ncbi:MAG: MarR family winged helix-turn-helix transcriptional regulator [Acidobacteriota bacterium]
MHDITPDSIEIRIATGLERLAQALRSHAWNDALPRGLTPTQGRILAFLADRPGTRLAELAEEIGVRPATASDAVRVLETKGLVAKSRHPEDRRALQLGLTPAGREVSTATSRWPELLADATVDLTDDEKVVLLGAVVRMIRQLQERGQIPIARMCPSCVFFRPRAHADPARPHHCAFVDAPLGDVDLRVDCPDHEVAAAPDAAAIWRRYVGSY